MRDNTRLRQFPLLITCTLTGGLAGTLAANLLLPTVFPDGKPESWPDGLIVILASLPMLGGMLAGIWLHGAVAAKRQNSGTAITRRSLLWRIPAFSVFALALFTAMVAAGSKLSVSLTAGYAEAAEPQQ
ncbi:hypothetical protein K3718_06160 [Leisingera aquaemixtae]|uniref:Uncharacterized protein n=1 Tax=Leisingera aquaemixtae TaxID=1396826 RepID=A0ABY5WML4_9RHOB|nr:hypothetical protein [Leisingera aquaemixtae]UWQ42670.1 hypothetical protein K3718_06160 [Leisingera aquaemixtae]